MKITFAALATITAFVLFTSCNNKKDQPDISGIRVDLSIERFDKDLFAIDTNDLSASLQQLAQKHPAFYADYMQQILGVSGNPADSNTVMVIKHFLNGYATIQDTLAVVYQNTDGLKKNIEEAFRYVKYYFPRYKTGHLIFFTGPFDAPGVALTGSGLAIGLQQFAGKNFSVYQSPEAQEMFPLYISRRFDPAFIPANCMKAVVQDLFADKSAGKPLVEQMVEKGKQWWLLDKFLPETADSLKTGFTEAQLQWCKTNEGLIWSYIYTNEDLNSISPAVIQTYIGEAPFTQGLNNQESPGNIGQWIGWQILKKYASKHPEMKPADIMNMEARKILEEAKYKPK